MTTFTTLNNTTLSQDKPLTQSVVRALRDNPVAMGEGDATAPKSEEKGNRTGAFSAATAAGGGVSHSSGAVVPFSVEDFDIEGWFNPAAGQYRYTPQRSGLYLISCMIFQGTGGTATGGTYVIRKNGSSVIPEATIGAANVRGPALTVLVYLNGSTDYIDVVVSFTGGSMTLAGGSSNWLRGALIGYAP
ncbi:hypothetical protein EN866_19555 [Mesorhizobium sp. M2D.F.Ca.ET.223.01.1.1]|uniref:hypothetical protein n=1 Tax=unclassified Mesorhizobium TaxID=325217 RepID=UPI000FCB59CC|nr:MULTISPECIES: hypothetical protein [unclassified Mesorhizobium]TGP89358.1 hypothetical protein EN864_19565 [bacterium M00.F.Ca.ET.221.01.1.1]TGP94731.1 hypothetical protein EN865_15435 [bacterium M00.F.Ca.ET.222.01.1.1]RVD58855.1 hypothetical protein EN783_14560 [Mesorhizobium sp. M2D.F.Ca.ET.140.01.1.1]TGP27884.1 hypothetical protein EN875_033045 [Mesorhizobium sp. M2D.F.Ca.ET.232.01.1.1]TGP75899.1 hypothetical protein EN867_15435 [Mesorhizobium sp. M2D.F.Ca.ET.224.01.1.1]